jgi:hypothetical protein
MSNLVRGFLVVLALCAAAAAVYWFVLREKPQAPPAPAEAPPAAAPAVPAAPAPHAEPGAPLPALADSDAELLQALSRLLGSGA